MAGSRKRPPATERAAHDLVEHVAALLKEVVAPGERITLGLSGGIDSMVLLDVLAQLAAPMSFHLRALHVNHQLSFHARDWARFCRSACRARAVACRVEVVDVLHENGLERGAREARYAIFERIRTDYVVLAHNADDQAETVLLQLLRGAGVKGLSGMGFVSTGVAAGRGAARYLRPLLETPRSMIESYARARELQWVSDESNEDTWLLRNWLRHEILPAVQVRVPGYRASVNRAARHCAEAARLLDDLARLDAREVANAEGLDLMRLRRLPEARIRNVLRFTIASRGWLMPDARRLEEAVRQALVASRDAQVCVDLGSCELRRFRDEIRLMRRKAPPRSPVRLVWQGERRIAVPTLGGHLTMSERLGRGLSLARLANAPVTIRTRGGGERLQPQAARPRRRVKSLLQEAGVPPWERQRLPFIYCGEDLACIPGVAIDCRFRAGPGERGVVPVWKARGS
jgi:tRNA(Ile)-lysidine synthase